MPDRTKKIRFRLLLLANFGFVWALALALRLVDLQIMKREFLQEKAENQQRRAVELDAMRGFIFDRRGEVLAASTEAPSVFASPPEVKDVDAAARVLVSVLGGEREQYARRLTSRGSFVWIERKISETEASLLQENLPAGVYLMPETKRLYPKGSLAAHILGYVGVDGQGLAGLEQTYDSYVRGQPGLMLSLRDARGSQYRRWVRRQPVHGMDLRLTIDEVIQHIAEREVERAFRETQAKSVIAVVMDPSTGRILAMANAPTFDPNSFQDFPREAWRNRSIQDAYEPGSTFKVITAASALSHDMVKPWESIYCEKGAIYVARTRIRDHDPYEDLTFREVIAKSSNVGAIKVGLRLPADVFFRDIREFGFGNRTLIDLPGESPGLLRPPKRWSKISQASLSMGQEIGATPLQMCTAFSAVANGGRLLRPYVVDRIVGADGRTQVRNHPEVLGHPVSPDTAAVLAEILKGVVSDGTGRAAAIEGVEVAGKTGTAQKVVDGRYSHEHYLASFVGFVPARRPRLTVGVFVDEPQGKYYGGQVAAPVFKRIAEPVLRLLGVIGLDQDNLQPSDHDGRELVRVYAPDVESDPRRPAPSLPRASEESEPMLRAEAVPPPRVGEVPDVTGQPLRDAFRLVHAASLDLKAMGSGLAIRQEPSPGSYLQPGEPVTVYFEGS